MFVYEVVKIDYGKEADEWVRKFYTTLDKAKVAILQGCGYTGMNDNRTMRFNGNIFDEGIQADWTNLFDKNNEIFIDFYETKQVLHYYAVFKHEVI